MFASVLREVTSVCERWDSCLKQDLQDLLGLSGWASRALVCSYERLRVFASVLREVTSVCERWDSCLKLDLQDLLGLSGWASQALVCSYERLRVFASVIREITSVCERFRRDHKVCDRAHCIRDARLAIGRECTYPGGTQVGFVMNFSTRNANSVRLKVNCGRVDSEPCP